MASELITQRRRIRRVFRCAATAFPGSSTERNTVTTTTLEVPAEDTARFCAHLPDEARPLLAQRLRQPGRSSATYTGSSYVLANCVEGILRDYVERLSGLSPLDVDECCEVLTALTYWADEADRLEAVGRVGAAA
jgi:hypothetical protein